MALAKVLLAAVAVGWWPCPVITQADEDTGRLVTRPVFECAMDQILLKPSMSCRAGGSALTACQALYDSFYTAMAMYSVNENPERVASFIATVMHETDRMASFYDEDDHGRPQAGAIHMSPTNLRNACCQMPYFRSQMAEYRIYHNGLHPNDQIPDCGGTTNLGQCGGECIDQENPQGSCMNDENIAKTVDHDINLGFMTAAWFFQNGYGGLDTCGSPLADADRGRGSFDNGNAAGRQGDLQCFFASGFYKVSCCAFGSFGTGNDAWGVDGIRMDERLVFYDEAIGRLEECLPPAPPAVDTSGGGGGVHPAVMIGGAVAILMVVVGMCKVGGGLGRSDFGWSGTRVRLAARPFQTQHEMLGWLKENFPQHNGVVPADAYTWSLEQLIEYIHTGQIPEVVTEGEAREAQTSSVQKMYELPAKHKETLAAGELMHIVEPGPADDSPPQALNPPAAQNSGVLAAPVAAVGAPGVVPGAIDIGQGPSEGPPGVPGAAPPIAPSEMPAPTAPYLPMPYHPSSFAGISGIERRHQPTLGSTTGSTSTTTALARSEYASATDMKRHENKPARPVYTSTNKPARPLYTTSPARPRKSPDANKAATATSKPKGPKAHTSASQTARSPATAPPAVVTSRDPPPSKDTVTDQAKGPVQEATETSVPSVSKGTEAQQPAPPSTSATGVDDAASDDEEATAAAAVLETPSHDPYGVETSRDETDPYAP